MSILIPKKKKYRISDFIHLILVKDLSFLFIKEKISLSEILRVFSKQFLVQLAHIYSLLPGADVPVIWNVEGEDMFSRRKGDASHKSARLVACSS